MIKFERGILENLMGDLRAVVNLIDVNEDSCEDFHNFHKECSDRLDFFEMEHHSLIRTVCDNISEKEQEACEIHTRLSIGSQLSHFRSSRHSRSSHHSRSSRHSHSSRPSSRCSSHSSHSSSSSVETLMEAAALKAKLKFIDIEAKTSADLEKIKTLKAIEIARAKLETLDEIDGTGNASVLNDMKIIKSEVISPNSLTDIPNTLEFNELNSEVPQIVHSFEPHFYTDVSATQVKSHVNSESFFEQSVSNTSFATSVTLPPSVPAQSIRRESVISSNPTISTLNPNVDAVIPRPSEPAVTTSSESTSFVWSHQYQRPAASSIAPTHMNVNTSVNEQLAPTESTCRSPNLEQGLLSLANSLAQQMSLRRLPPPEPNIFYGDPLKYPGWKVAFQALIEQRQIPVTERIHYLKKYICGQVKDVIENYFLITTSDSFEEAKSALDQRYGDPFIISSAFRNKLDKWPKIASRDGPGLQKFSDF